mmetsp:Transcript_104147/g.335828  ORF Transcript_104147/g.335828 Transcript_104147/m.335828 type:complete len:236 (-) Transcript_104147:560-1267(-)
MPGRQLGLRSLHPGRQSGAWAPTRPRRAAEKSERSTTARPRCWRRSARRARSSASRCRPRSTPWRSWTGSCTCNTRSWPRARRASPGQRRTGRTVRSQCCSAGLCQRPRVLGKGRPGARWPAWPQARRAPKQAMVPRTHSTLCSRRMTRSRTRRRRCTTRTHQCGALRSSSPPSRLVRSSPLGQPSLPSAESLMSRSSREAPDQVPLGAWRRSRSWRCRARRSTQRRRGGTWSGC